jgi:hypothetical protein
MNRRFAVSAGGRAVTVLLSIALAGMTLMISAEAAPPGLQSEDARGASCWILIDLDGFSCGLCLEALLAFCRAIPEELQERGVRGILAFRAPQGKDAAARQTGILTKKWNGFRKANDIRFPAFVDVGGVFAGQPAASVFLFDESAGTLRAFPLPLRQGQLEIVLAVLRK